MWSKVYLNQADAMCRVKLLFSVNESLQDLHLHGSDVSFQRSFKAKFFITKFTLEWLFSFMDSGNVNFQISLLHFLITIMTLNVFLPWGVRGFSVMGIPNMTFQ